MFSLSYYLTIYDLECEDDGHTERIFGSFVKFLNKSKYTLLFSKS